MSKNSVSLCACLFALTLVLTGCGSGPTYYPVSGTVEFKADGSKAQFGTIEFRSKTDPPVVARGTIEKDGTFSLWSSGNNGTIEGSHTVVIIQVVGDSRSRKILHNHGLEVATKYSDHRTTDLIAEVNKETSSDLKLLVDSKDD